MCRLTPLLCLFLLASPASSAAERLALYYDLRPPLVTVVEGRLGGSLGSRATEVLQRAGIEVDLVAANVARQDHDIAQNLLPACALGRLQTPERSRHGQFSHVLFVTAPYVALARRGQHYPQPTTLQSWAADARLTWGLQRGLHYSDRVQLLLAGAQATTAYSAQSNQQLAKMLAAGRLDFMLVHEDEARELLRGLPAGGPLRIVALQDMQAPEQRYFYCSHRVSSELMQRLNSALQAPSPASR